MTTSSALQLSPSISRAHGPSSSPTPVSWAPSQYWDGNNGNWSSFALRVGSPEQVVRVLISTAGVDTFVVEPLGCPPDTPGKTSSLTCPQSRGELFDSKLSSTWASPGNYSLGLDVNLGYDNAGSYGLDTVALGFSNASGGPALQRQVVAAFATYKFYTGLFGLGNQPTNFTASDDSNNLTNSVPQPSFLTTMKNLTLIPSLSWAYTAGAIYQGKGFFGSLTFGGYDLSRLIPNNVTFNLAPDVSRDLVVGLQSITSTAANGSKISLLPNAILTFIDSTLPYIWLPLEACQAFEDAFGLTYNDTDRLYTVDDRLHQSLTARNPNFTFQIGNSLLGGPTVDIVLPYASFDLNLSYPIVANSARYFPLKRAANTTQYTLGRTFLQEAYIITNYEHSNFSVSQARFDDGLAENIIPLPSADDLTAPKSHTHISRNSIIGLAVGLATFLFLVALLIYFTRKRLRKPFQSNDTSEHTEPPGLSEKVRPMHLSELHEAADNSSYFRGELPDNGKVELFDNGKVELLDGNSPSGSGNQISEMPQSSSPAPLFELGTRHTSLATSSLRRQSDRNRNVILVNTDIWRRESSDSSRAVKKTPCVETRISHSPRHKSLEFDRSPPSPPQLTPEYLNRALPSPPTSDSTIVSPTKTVSSSPVSATNRLQSLSSATSIDSCGSVIGCPETALDSIWKDYDMSWEETHRRPEPSLFSSNSTDIKIMMTAEVTERHMREYPSMSSISTDIEIVVPPGTPESQMPHRARSREDQRRTYASFI